MELNALAKPWRKLTALAKSVLQSGLMPAKLSLTICLGASVSMMPIPWTTVICALLAARFRLNLAAIQAVNYLCYPLQIALFIPFCQLGQALLPWGPKVSASLLSGVLQGHLGSALSLIVWACARGLGAWLITVPPAALLIFPLLKRLLERRRSDQEAA
jgi:uncharacterized protein (DUF2062 family)